jgi:signal transduction histidine kinase/CheY-like chemotaxis protein
MVRVITALARAITRRDVARAALTEGLEAAGASSGLLRVLSADGAQLETIDAVGMTPELPGEQRVALDAHTAETEAFLTQRPVLITSRQESRRHDAELPAPSAVRTGTRAVYPLIADGRALGTIGYGFTGFVELNEEQRGLMQAFAGQCAQALDRARLYEAERSARAELEAAQRRSAFLLEASTILASSLEYQDTLSRVARLAAERVADLCSIDLADVEGRTVALEVAHVDAARRELACEMRRRMSFDPEIKLGTPAVMRSGKSELYPNNSAALRQRLTDPVALRIAQELEFDGGSIMAVPMIARGRTLGVITFTASTQRRRYDSSDLKMAEDLAQRAAMAIDNARLYLEMREAVRTREDLLGVVSHDLRNPLTGLLMRCTLLLETLPNDGVGQQVRPDIEAMSRSAHRMQRMLSDLMDFASIQAGHLAVERRPHLLSDLLREATDSLNVLAGRRSITLVTDDLDPGLRVMCDRERLLQVFSNLLGNAVKFTGPEGSIRILAQHRGAEAQFSVEDDGPGIPQNELPKIFQKYWQRPHGPRAGVGLGLYIAKTLVEAHGGRIWAESRPGAGSAFRFTIPVVPGPGENAEVRAPHGIMLVDDDALFRRELAEVLTREGYTVVEAADGRIALNHLRTQPLPRMILLDLMMPAMDGWEFAATIRADPMLANIPVVVMSSLDRVEINAALLGATDSVRKPVRLPQLLDLAARYAGGTAPAAASVQQPS